MNSNSPDGLVVGAPALSGPRLAVPHSGKTRFDSASGVFFELQFIDVLVRNFHLSPQDRYSYARRACRARGSDAIFPARNPSPRAIKRGGDQPVSNTPPPFQFPPYNYPIVYGRAAAQA